MKNSIHVLAILLIASLGFSQEIQLEKFDALKVSTGHDVILIPGKSNYAEVEMKRGEIENLIVEVNGSQLKIKSKKSGWFSSKTEAEVKVYYTEAISNIDVSSGASIECDDPIVTEVLDINASSGARCDLHVNTTELEVDISSGSKVMLEGTADNQNVDCSSGAKYRGMKMKTKKSRVDASSGSRAVVYCSERINADVSSGAKIEYYGNPSKKEIDGGKYSGGSIVAK